MELEELIKQREEAWRMYEEFNPSCPQSGCGRKMVIKNSRYGDFWGCPMYPECRGHLAMSPTYHAVKRKLLEKWAKLADEVRRLQYLSSGH